MHRGSEPELNNFFFVLMAIGGLVLNHFVDMLGIFEQSSYFIIASKWDLKGKKHRGSRKDFLTQRRVFKTLTLMPCI